MKNKILFRFFALLIASAIFGSCSKDNLQVNKQQPGTPAAPVSEAFIKVSPVSSGSISGIFSPVPAYAEITVFTADIIKKVFGRTIANEKGWFKVENLPAGIYSVSVKYILSDVELGYYPYFTIQGVEVFADKDTDLGTISLR